MVADDTFCRGECEKAMACINTDMPQMARDRSRASEGSVRIHLRSFDGGREVRFCIAVFFVHF